ncbi:MAG: aldehyde dehydrogenase family protein [Polyangiaceae bacterium]
MSEAVVETAVPAVKSSPFAATSPIDGEALDAVLATPLADLPAMVQKAREGQQTWGALSPYERIKVLRAVKDRVLDRAARFADVVHREVGKPKVEVVLGEVLPSADVVVYWCDQIEELLDPTDVTLDSLSYPGKSGTLYRDPRGVIALITPWNYPVALPLRSLLPALLAGNAVLFKPSEVSPRSGALVQELFEGLLPAGVLQIVQGGGDAGAALSASDVDLVIFTGSVATGRKVAHACAERLSPCSLELGGKDAAIVLADANLDRAANGVVWGALTNAGQNCAAIERVYVEKSIADAFRAKVVEVVKALPAKDVGPLTTEAQRATVVKHVADAQEKGGKLLAGGEKAEKGYGYSPAVLSVDDDANQLMTDETFGPVIPIAVVDNAEQAIERANASRYGLTASIWTKKVRVGEALAKKLRAGVVTINNHAFTGALPAAPWSGQGETGYGITNSPLALDAMTRPRFVLVDKNKAKRELWWYPYTPTLETIAYTFCVLRSGTSGIFKKLGAIFTLIRNVPKRLMGG